MVMSGTPLFSDLDLSNSGIPTLDPDIYKNDGIYVGEAKIEAKLKNGKYKCRLPDGRIFQARPSHATGETIYPSGTPVLAICYNADSFILGRIRSTKDEASSDGEVETDSADKAIGNSGDASLRPANPKEDTPASVTVTGGGVVAVRSTGENNITLHPGGLCVHRSETLRQLNHGYSFDSGKLPGKVGSVGLSTISTHKYTDRVGPARTEVRVKNGKVGNPVVHEFSVNNLVTAGGVTTGAANFKWTVDGTGNWQITSANTIKFGDFANEPIVLGKQYVTLTKALILDQTTINAANLAAMATLTPLLTTALTLTLSIPMTSIGNFMGLVILYPSLIAMAAAFTALYTASTTNLTAQQLLYLTPYGITNELVLSDLMSTQKILASPFPIIE